ncbi:eukaryotic peptide chain release factor GTP-binding subunit ERF3A-like isoform X1 [Zophobas morio]|uniref:eukaryotic peptide chain release factor GTP-binding subunit ERF3A-like isoform X1 n=1 Tax=Zophobas morio TaxID=2755281 RepID=UPI003082E903
MSSELTYNIDASSGSSPSSGFPSSPSAATSTTFPDFSKKFTSTSTIENNETVEVVNKKESDIINGIGEKLSCVSLNSDMHPEKEVNSTHKFQQISKAEKEHLNVIIIGHVDAGKSTIGGHLMVLTGQVDARTLAKYAADAKLIGRESWYLSWALDTNEEEREKGKTVEVGRAHFCTENKKFTILDAPGHNLYISQMISGVSQADIGILVISARRGEFEAGFERDGQTREHALLAKTAGVRFMVVLVNKMDDISVEWSSQRYNEILEKLVPFLKKFGYVNGRNAYFIPCSGLTGANLKDPLPEGFFPAYKGPSLLQFLDRMKPIPRQHNAPVRLPILDKYKDMGVIIAGKLDSGMIQLGKKYTLMPNKIVVEVQQIVIDEEEAEVAPSGCSLKLKIKGAEEDDVHPGHVLCESSHLCPAIEKFDAVVRFMNLEGGIVTSGYTCVLHCHALIENATLLKIIGKVDDKGELNKKHMFPKFARSDEMVMVRLQTDGRVCVETFKDFPSLGRITLRDEKRTVAIGKITKLVG